MASMALPFKFLYFSSNCCYLVPSRGTPLTREFALEILLTHPDQVIRDWVKGVLLKRDL